MDPSGYQRYVDGKYWDLSYLTAGSHTVTTSLENDLAKAEHALPYDPAIPLLGTCPTDMCADTSARSTGVRMLRATVLVIASN